MAETFQRTSTQLLTTGATDIYAAPSGAPSDRAVVLACVATNVDGVDPVDVSVDITTAGDTVLSSFASTITVPPNASLELVANKLILVDGEKLRASSSVASGLDMAVSVLEITNS